MGGKEKAAVAPPANDNSGEQDKAKDNSGHDVISDEADWGVQEKAAVAAPWKKATEDGAETNADTGKGSDAQWEKGAKATQPEQQGKTAVADLMDLGVITTKAPEMQN